MKRNLLFTGICALLFISCRKDRTCECNETTTYVAGNTYIETVKPTEKIEYEDIKPSKAKSLCQKSTLVINDSLTTTTIVNDCELK